MKQIPSVLITDIVAELVNHHVYLNTISFSPSIAIQFWLGANVLTTGLNNSKLKEIAVKSKEYADKLLNLRGVANCPPNVGRSKIMREINENLASEIADFLVSTSQLRETLISSILPVWGNIVYQINQFLLRYPPLSETMAVNLAIAGQLRNLQEVAPCPDGTPRPPLAPEGDPRPLPLPEPGIAPQRCGQCYEPYTKIVLFSGAFGNVLRRGTRYGGQLIRAKYCQAQIFLKTDPSNVIFEPEFTTTLVSDWVDFRLFFRDDIPSQFIQYQSDSLDANLVNTTGWDSVTQWRQKKIQENLPNPTSFYWTVVFLFHPDNAMWQDDPRAVEYYNELNGTDNNPYAWNEYPKVLNTDNNYIVYGAGDWRQVSESAWQPPAPYPATPDSTRCRPSYCDPAPPPLPPRPQDCREICN